MVYVFDNGGRTPDRYTVILEGQAFTCSPPRIPSCCAVAQDLGPVEGLNFAVLGERVELKDLSSDVRKDITAAAHTIMRALVHY